MIALYYPPTEGGVANIIIFGWMEKNVNKISIFQL